MKQRPSPLAPPRVGVEEDHHVRRSLARVVQTPRQVCRVVRPADEPRVAPVDVIGRRVLVGHLPADEDHRRLVAGVMTGVGPRDAPLDLGHGADDVHDEAAVARERTAVDPDRGLQGREEGPGRSGEILPPAMRGVVAASEEDGAVGARGVRRVETRREDEREEEDRRAEGPGAGHRRRLSRIERAPRNDAGANAERRHLASRN